MKKVEQLYRCGKCDEGIVKAIRVDTTEHVTIEIKKCTHCKYPYGIKGVGKLVKVGSIPMTLMFPNGTVIKVTSGDEIVILSDTIGGNNAIITFDDLQKISESK